MIYGKLNNIFHKDHCQYFMEAFLIPLIPCEFSF